MSFKIKQGENSPVTGEIFTNEEMKVVNMGLGLVKQQLEEFSQKQENDNLNQEVDTSSEVTA